MKYLLIFILLLALELLYFKLADKFNIIDKPNQRSSHSRITLRGGGIIFYLGIVLYTCSYGFTYPWFLLGLTLICLISFVDDIHSVSSKIRVLFHFVAMLLMFYQWGLYTDFPWWYIGVALVFCTGVLNAYNFMDGINGITGGYSLVILSTLAYINYELVSFVDPPFIYVSLLSVVVFNLFNFEKKAKCFAGDVGSIGIAFIILFLLGKLILTTGSLYWIILLAVYGVDSILTIVHRLMLHENIFEPHRKHAYQIMANELGIPHVKVSVFYMCLQLLINFGTIYFVNNYHWTYLILVIITLCSGYIFFINKFFNKITIKA